MVFLSAACTCSQLLSSVSSKLFKRRVIQMDCWAPGQAEDFSPVPDQAIEGCRREQDAVKVLGNRYAAGGYGNNNQPSENINYFVELGAARTGKRCQS